MVIISDSRLLSNTRRVIFLELHPHTQPTIISRRAGHFSQDCSNNREVEDAEGEEED